MKTLTADKYKRVRIPDAKPKQVFAYTKHSDGTLTLSPVKTGGKEPFPRGSLLKYVTRERDDEIAEIASGCVQGPE